MSDLNQKKTLNTEKIVLATDNPVPVAEDKPVEADKTEVAPVVADTADKTVPTTDNSTVAADKTAPADKIVEADKPAVKVAEKTSAADKTAVLLMNKAIEVVRKVLESKDKVSELSNYTPDQVLDTVMVLKLEKSKLQSQKKIQDIKSAFAVEEASISKRFNQEIDSIPVVKEVKTKYDTELKNTKSGYERQIVDIVASHDNNKKAIEAETDILKQEKITVSMKTWLEQEVKEIVEWSDIIRLLSKNETLDSVPQSDSKPNSDSGQNLSDPANIDTVSNDVTTLGDTSTDDSL